MIKIGRRNPFLLVLGDVAVLVLSLWFALVLRYLALPSPELFFSHFEPFSFVFFAWVVVFFIAGLYEKHTLILERRLPALLFQAFLANAFLAVVFFYFVPLYDIAPKTNLFIILVVSFTLMLLWRVFAATFSGYRSREDAIVIASGPELIELEKEVNENRRYPFRFVVSADLSQADASARIARALEEFQAPLIVADFADKRLAPALPRFYDSLAAGGTFIDFAALYEDAFERVPLSLISHEWFIENFSLAKKPAYDTLKRLMDIALALPVGILWLAMLPFVALAIKLQDGGPVWISQERIGRGGKIVHIYKFRTMRGNDRGVWVGKNDDRITPVGRFLRKSRIDEFMQFWNVIRGDISFIGPRPDIIGTYEGLVKDLPYYRMRTVVAPGLSGWAQISQKLPPQSLEETRLRLAYDFYYIKNRSFALDLQIALRTIQTLLSRLGV